MGAMSVHTLLPTTNHAGSLPTSVVGSRVRAASHDVYGRRLQTISWNLGSGVGGATPRYFSGTITVQASLSTTPGAFDWFDVYTIPVSATPTGQSGWYNLVGKYTWLRVVVTDWTAGQIGSVSVCY